MERVRGAAAVRRRVGEAIDELQLLDDRARPSVTDDQRQRVIMLRAHVDEVDVQPVDLGDELRQGIEGGLDLAPVVLRLPVTRELLHRRERHALRFIRYGLLLGPLRRRDAPTQFRQRLIRNIDLEGVDFSGGFDGARHDEFLGVAANRRNGAYGPGVDQPPSVMVMIVLPCTRWSGAKAAAASASGRTEPTIGLRRPS